MIMNLKKVIKWQFDFFLVIIAIINRSQLISQLAVYYGRTFKYTMLKPNDHDLHILFHPKSLTYWFISSLFVKPFEALIRKVYVDNIFNSCCCTQIIFMRSRRINIKNLVFILEITANQTSVNFFITVAVNGDTFDFSCPFLKQFHWYCRCLIFSTLCQCSKRTVYYLIWSDSNHYDFTVKA